MCLVRNHLIGISIVSGFSGAVGSGTTAAAFVTIVACRFPLWLSSKTSGSCLPVSQYSILHLCLASSRIMFSTPTFKY